MFIKELLEQPIISLDTETDDKHNPHRVGLKGVSIAWGDKEEPERYYWDFEKHGTPLWNSFRKRTLGPLFERNDLTITYWNAKFDLQVVGGRGFWPKGTVEDVQAMGYLLDETTPNDLKDNIYRLQGKKRLTYKQTVTLMKKMEREGEQKIKRLKRNAWDLYKNFGKNGNGTGWLHEEPGKMGLARLAASSAEPGLKKKEFDDHAENVIRAAVEPKVRKEIDGSFTKYAEDDAVDTFVLHHVYEPRLKAEEELYSHYKNVLMPVVLALPAIETRGVKVDIDILTQLEKAYGTAIEEFKEKIAEECGEELNPQSTDQLREYFWQTLGIEPPQWAYKKKAQKVWQNASTKASVLEWLFEQGYGVAGDILKLRRLNKIKGTYIDALKERALDDPEGRIHCSFNPTTVETGRWSSSGPNLQNVPTPRTTSDIIDGLPSLRRCFVARDGYVLFKTDFSQIELRVLAHITQDNELLRAYQSWKCYDCGSEGTLTVVRHECPECGAPDGHYDIVAEEGVHFVLGEDIHAKTALATGLIQKYGFKAGRDRGKTLNFAMVYGMGVDSLATALDIDIDTARDVHAGYFLQYPEVRKFHKWVEYTISDRGYFKLISGQRRRFFSERDKIRNGTIKNWEYYGAIREGGNAIVQGGAAHLMNMAIRNVGAELLNKEKYGDSGIVLQVHDEMVVEAPKEKASVVGPMVIRKMENVARLRVPIIADQSLGIYWGEAA